MLQHSFQQRLTLILLTEASAPAPTVVLRVALGVYTPRNMSQPHRRLQRPKQRSTTKA